MTPLPDTLAAEDADLVSAVDALVARHGSARGELLPLLQDLLADRGEISDLAVQVVADRLGIAPTEVQGVVTFYKFLGTGPRGRHMIRLCHTLSCVMAGARDVATTLETELAIPVGATTPDGAVTLEWANCIGMCATPPALLADAEAFGDLTPERVREIVAAVRAADVPG
ncbi:MAG: NAD(P)H-dependent oxidoreductase subunit E [Propionibacterium sp.]|nr:NAD(P)H-dependent oxidoreductase subunit E [Propionibacterium sp.]